MDQNKTFSELYPEFIRFQKEVQKSYEDHEAMVLGRIETLQVIIVHHWKLKFPKRDLKIDWYGGTVGVEISGRYLDPDDLWPDFDWPPHWMWDKHVECLRWLADALFIIDEMLESTQNATPEPIEVKGSLTRKENT